MVQLRRQKFRQAAQNFAANSDLLARDFVQYDGICASKCAVTNLCGIALNLDIIRK